MKCAVAFAVALGLALTGVAVAQTADVGATPLPVGSDPSLIESDRAAVAAIVMSAVTEVKLCRLAIEKSQNADVRALCRNASADNARTAIAGMQLAQALGATGVKLQESPHTPDVLDTLAQYSGSEFDREFLLGQIEDAEDDEHAIRYDLEVANDTSVKRYESVLLTKVVRRLEGAESALRQVDEDTP